jgi:hypothetical protein
MSVSGNKEKKISSKNTNKFRFIPLSLRNKTNAEKMEKLGEITVKIRRKMQEEGKVLVRKKNLLSIAKKKKNFPGQLCRFARAPQFFSIDHVQPWRNLRRHGFCTE